MLVGGADPRDHGDPVHLVGRARGAASRCRSAQREGAYALGATRFEAIRAALFYARTGIVGAVMLGFGRALGETMAVTMVIGNNPQVSLSLFAPQYTMAAVIANEFTEAADELYLRALVEIGLVLFIITLIVNSLSRLLIWSMARSSATAAPEPPRPCRGGGGMTPTGCRKLLSSAVRRRSARCRCCSRSCRWRSSCSSSSARASRRSTSSSSRTCRQPVGEAGRRHGERHRRHADRWPAWRR